MRQPKQSLKQSSVELHRQITARASVGAAFVWEPPGSVLEPCVVPTLALGEAPASIAELARGFELPVYVAVMLAVLSVLDGQAFTKADTTANAGTAIEGGVGVGDSQSRQRQSASVTMPGDMDMTTAASLRTAIGG
jgi:hypothetical protein